MKTQMAWHRNKGDTVNGESVSVIYTYSSMDKSEIDRIEELFKQNIDCGLVIEGDTDGKDNN